MKKTKKLYINPVCEFISFNFEAITADTTTNPSPLVNPSISPMTTTSSNINNQLLESLPPGVKDYTGTQKYVGATFNPDNFSSN